MSQKCKNCGQENTDWAVECGRCEATLHSQPFKDEYRLNDRKLFVVTFKVESDELPPLPKGEGTRTIHVPAFVEDMAQAEQKALEYAANFKNTQEGKQSPNAKLTIQSIVVGGTLLI